MRVEEVHAAIARLPEEFREALVLREIEELSYEEIVEITGVPLGTVKSRINRARARLVQMLQKQIKDERP
jgi:RNA polymerase sigma-70 factor (ECF subfamily)